ncbi:13018_t:CDS:2 [Funneliformis geosporum]|uniref:13018_t:CDS:1 n=1 Tax=Funneliformis geosporum TaxID=1117311 RepID=A0A9W4SGD6_9GLOM|nr:13018_t:CDS:2 [Funneliformis geosporum]
MEFSSGVEIPFVCVFIMFLLYFVALVPVRKAQAQQDEGYDNSNPRDQYNRLPIWGKRAVGAANNTFEGLVFFSIAVFTYAFSHVFNLNPFGNKYQKIEMTANILCIIYIILRVIYFPLYWFDYPKVRSSVWTIGLLCILSLFIISFI